MSARFDAVIVGSGILGLASAWAFAQRGLRVVVVERDPAPVGAFIRNFGMVWPIGQPPGRMYELALRSRDRWLELLAEAGIWHRHCGSIHALRHPLEMQVAEEFLAADTGIRAEMISPAQARQRCRIVREEGLLGAIWSGEELCVNPVQVPGQLIQFLRGKGVEFRFSTSALSADAGRLETSAGTLHADRILICPGDQMTLFGEEMREAGVTRCRLQMLRAVSEPPVDMGSHFCAGLTLAHYESFARCPSLPELKAHFGQRYPGQVEHGIHLLVSQHQDGAFTIGDSHHYGDEAPPFRREEVDELILAYLAEAADIPSLRITERWQGVYAKRMDSPYLLLEPKPGVALLTVTSGIGMTLSMGLGEAVAGLMTERTGWLSES